LSRSCSNHRTLSLAKPANCHHVSQAKLPRLENFKSYLASVHVRQVERVPGELGSTARLPLNEVGVGGACEGESVRNHAEPPKHPF
jgi:hypothetical protein